MRNGNKELIPVNRAEDMPERDHYAVIATVADKPGIVYQAFYDRPTWETYVKALTKTKNLVGAMYVKVARVESRVNIQVADHDPISSGGEA